MSSRACATRHIVYYIKDPEPLIEKRRELSPGGRFPPGFIHRVIIVTGLNKLYDILYVLALKMASCRCRLGVKPPLKLKLYLRRLRYRTHRPEATLSFKVCYDRN